MRFDRLLADLIAQPLGNLQLAAPNLLGPSDMGDIKASGQFFAREFDEELKPGMLDRITAESLLEFRTEELDRGGNDLAHGIQIGDEIRLSRAHQWITVGVELAYFDQWHDCQYTLVPFALHRKGLTIPVGRKRKARRSSMITPIGEWDSVSQQSNDSESSPRISPAAQVIVIQMPEHPRSVLLTLFQVLVVLFLVVLWFLFPILGSVFFPP